MNFVAGGISTPSDAALVMQLGAEGVFVGSGIFKSEDPARMANAIVQATTHFADAEDHRRGLQGPGGADARHRHGGHPGAGAARGPRLVGGRPAAGAGAMRIGVLALQGAFAEHVSTLRAIGVEAVEVRLPEHLDDVDGLILPGGESTTMRRLIDRWGMRAADPGPGRARRAAVRDLRRDDRAGAARSPAARSRSCRCST